MTTGRCTLALPCLLLLASACGGGAGGAEPRAKSPGGDAKDEKKESIGELAASQGGLSALGGAGNREESGATGTEVAMSATLGAEEVDKGKPVKLDGVLKEWPARSPMRDAVSGKTEGLGLDVAVQYDDAKLYVAAEVSDPRTTRTAKHDAGDDHLRLVLAFPSGRGALKAYEVGFWAGKPGESSGAVKWLSGPQKGQEIAGARLVESDTKGGYAFEASVPWASFAEARTMRVGLRAAFRYHDGDGNGSSGVVGNGKGSVERPGELPPLPTAAEQAVVDGLLAQKNLAGEPPKIDVFADLAGDDRKERVSVFGRFFTVCGPGYRGGHQFFWRESTGDIVSLEARDVTGRGKDDLVVRRRIATKTSVRETLEVWSLVGGDEPVTVFAHETAVASTDGKHRVTNAVRVSTKEIEVAVEPPVGWDAKSYKEGTPSDTEPVLLPWGTVKSRTFKYEGGRFAKASEVAQAGAPVEAAPASSAPAPALPKDLPTPASKPASADLGKQVLEAYQRDAGVAPGTKPRFDLEVNVEGDGRAERVLLFGKDIVVLGPGFKGGTGYAKMTLSQFESDKDVGELTVRDVTGDGAAEVLVRGVRRVSSANGERVDVEGLFIYQVKGGALTRVMAVETARELAGKRIQGLVQFVPAKGGKGFDVDVRPGVAKGWTEKTYPWPQEKPGGTMEPLLLPWSTTKSLRYTWNGTQFTTSAP